MSPHTESTSQKGYGVYAGELTPYLPDARVLRFTEVDIIVKDSAP